MAFTNGVKVRLVVIAVLLASWAWIEWQSAPVSPKPVSVVDHAPVTITHISQEDLEHLQRYEEALQEDITQAHTLEEVIALAKQKAASEGKELTEQTLEQHQRFDDVLYIKQLAEQAPLKGLSKEQALGQLIQHFKHDESVVDKKLDDMQLYEYAQKLYSQLGETLSPNVNAYLAKQTLQGSELEMVLKHEALKHQNHLEKEAYQEAYQQLMTRLSELRATSHKDLSEADWLAYQHAEIRRFKRAFFRP